MIYSFVMFVEMIGVGGEDIYLVNDFEAVAIVYYL